MSPLIATVLLMAFAVALGGMIMNWSIDAGTNSDCEDLSTHVKVLEFCSQGSDVILRMQADASGPAVQGIKLSVLTDDIENTVNVKNAELKPGERLDLSIPVLVKEGASRVDLLGIIGPKAEPYLCDQNPIERVDPIAAC